MFSKVWFSSFLSLSLWLSVWQSVAVHLLSCPLPTPTPLSVCLSLSLSVCLSVCLSLSLSLHPSLPPLVFVCVRLAAKKTDDGATVTNGEEGNTWPTAWLHRTRMGIEHSPNWLLPNGSNRFMAKPKNHRAAVLSRVHAVPTNQLLSFQPWLHFSFVQHRFLW